MVGRWCEQVMNTRPSGAMGAARERVFDRRAALRRITCCEGKRRNAAGGECNEPLSRQRHDWRPKKGRESSAATVADRLPEMLGGKVLHVHGGSLV